MKNSKILTALLSLVIAFSLWLYVITFVSSEEDQTFTNIPVVLQNESALTERGLMVTTENIPTVTLQLYGERSELSKVSSSNITLTLDLSQVYDEGVQNLSYRILYPGDVASGAFTILNQTPSLIPLNIESRVTKSVRLVADYGGTSPDPENYICDKENPVFSVNGEPISYVTVRGPRSVVDQIEQAVIEVDLTDRVESIIGESFTYRLCNGEGEAVDAKMITTEVGEVQLSLPILRFKEVPLTLTVTDGGGATAKTSDIKIEPKTIKVSGSDLLLEQLTEINIGTINLAEITEEKELPLFNIILQEGITNLTGTEQAKVTVSFPDLLTRSFKVTEFQITGVPEGMEAEILTQELTVNIRGPKALMENMKETDFQVVINFANVTAGTTTVKANIVFNSGYAAVGALGSHTVNATLRQIVEGENDGTTGPRT